MKPLLSLLLLTTTLNLAAQASWSTRIAFKLRDEHQQTINLAQFRASYQLLDVYGDLLPEKYWKHCFRFDPKSGYFILDISTIGPRYSFALRHQGELMVLYLPFIRKRVHEYYAVDISFEAGQYLLEFNTQQREELYLGSNVPFYIIEKINWKRQHRKFKQSSYSDDRTYH